MLRYRYKRRAYVLNEQQHRMLHSPVTGGIILITCAFIAILLANLELTKEVFHNFWNLKFTIGFEKFNLTKTIEEWINDGLMVVFFFVVGLEIKREIIARQLSTRK